MQLKPRHSSPNQPHRPERQSQVCILSASKDIEQCSGTLVSHCDAKTMFVNGSFGPHQSQMKLKKERNPFQRTNAQNNVFSFLFEVGFAGKQQRLSVGNENRCAK